MTKKGRRKPPPEFAAACLRNPESSWLRRMAQHLGLMVKEGQGPPTTTGLASPLAAAATGAGAPAAFGALGFEWCAPRVFPELAPSAAG